MKNSATYGLLIFLGGGLGSLLRFAISVWMQRGTGLAFPIGTLAVNALGCFGIGFCVTLLEQRSLMTPALRFFLLIGFFGGFTTFSTFGLETWGYLEAGKMIPALGNILANVIGCITLLYLGMCLARWGTVPAQ
ncbi:MAG: fluoride efflux transporter CrcB [Deltaproteobacteria bacterium]|nr:fluoride efflux transporter CrcB [Deltaproteobacteria bacterium]